MGIHPFKVAHWLVLVAALLASTLATAAPAPAPVRAEIEALLGVLAASRCEFNRNGAWHTGAEAQAHLLRKLDALEGRSLVQTTEHFIERGASASSSSGQAYQVRCAGAAPVPSRLWLTEQLTRLRAPARKP